MNRETAVQLKLTEVSEVFCESISAERIINTAKILCVKLNDEQIEYACKIVLMTERRFPPPVVFIDAAIGNQRQQADERVGEVFRAINKFGYMDPEGARDFLGPTTWRVIQNYGGWYNVCTNPDFNPGVFRAQFQTSVANQIEHEVKQNLLMEMSTRSLLKS